MGATVIDGKALAAAAKAEAAEKVRELKNRGINPCLAVILVGENPASQVYVRGKINDCAQCGIESRSINLPADTTQDALLDLQNQLDEAQTTIDALESSAEETDAALAEAQRENQALLALYTIQQQYSAGDLAGCQASIDAFEASEYRDALPETAEEGVTPPSQRYAQLKEAAEAR